MSDQMYVFAFGVIAGGFFTALGCSIAIRATTEALRARREPAVADGDYSTAAYFARFRSRVRGALWSFWPNNLGVTDDEIIDAIARLVATQPAVPAASSSDVPVADGQTTERSRAGRPGNPDPDSVLRVGGDA